MRDPIQALAIYLREHCERAVPLEEMSKFTGYSAFHLQRQFKAALGVSPKQFHAQCRRERLKEKLHGERSVTGALFEAGYGSTSRVYESAAATLGMTPKQYQGRGAGIEIGYVLMESRWGWLAIAATDRGLCALELGDAAAPLRARLREEFAGAKLAECPAPFEGALADWQRAIQAYLAGRRMPEGLPLDIRATAFQAEVWRFLQGIPAGETRSYGDVAAAIGRPKAVRAVARACAANPVALAIPCHRVIRGDGQLGGYRWGMARKEALLEAERQAAGY